MDNSQEVTLFINRVNDVCMCVCVCVCVCMSFIDSWNNGIFPIIVRLAGFVFKACMLVCCLGCQCGLVVGQRWWSLEEV